uniref:Syntaxin-81 isoform X2 n=1 Tax=Elaeis guineensis var. tenera TaxID=51953 RepID=A0A6J0PSQ8_ELAGV|nr:syntaxin-81 isoform X2 [Elaeis guineensis]
MANVRDRTEDFKDVVRAGALSLGYSESKLAAILASFIMHKPPQGSLFTKAALKTLKSIIELEHFIVKPRKDYVDLHRITEQERDNIEHEVGFFVKACKDQIDILKNRIHDEEKNGNSKTWLHIRDDTYADMVAHKHGVDAINRAMPKRKMHRIPDSKSFEASKPEFTELGEQVLPSGPMKVQDQLLDDETRALQVELTSLLDAVQETETNMVEMPALNHLMSTHVL